MVSSVAASIRLAPPGSSTRTWTLASLTGSYAGVTTRTATGTATPSGGASTVTSTGGGACTAIQRSACRQKVS